jgi:hypothetical protein
MDVLGDKREVVLCLLDCYVQDHCASDAIRCSSAGGMPIKKYLFVSGCFQEITDSINLLAHYQCKLVDGMTLQTR